MGFSSFFSKFEGFVQQCCTKGIPLRCLTRLIFFVEPFMKSFQKIGGILSLACAIHCLAMPILLLVAASSSWLAVLENPMVETGLLVILLPVCLFTLIKKPPQSRSFFQTSILLLGMLLPVAGLIFHMHWLLGIGGLLMAWIQLSKPHAEHLNRCC